MNLEHYRDQLLRLQQELGRVAETGKSSAETVELDQSRVGRLSRMDAMQSQAMSQATNQRRDLQLQKISAALQRISAGDYGYCLSCEDEIAEQRLEIDPACTLCIACAVKKRSLMGDVLPFKRPSLKKKAQGKTLCKSGFHQWEPITSNAFDVKRGKLVSAFRCKRCGKEKNESK